VKCFSCAVCKQPLNLTGVYRHSGCLLCETHKTQLLTETGGRTDDAEALIQQMIRDKDDAQHQASELRAVRHAAEANAKDKFERRRARAVSMDRKAAVSLKTKAKSIRKTGKAQGIVNVLANISGSTAATSSGNAV